jgi:hypothetical protein
MEAAVTPLPTELTTPPVQKTYLVTCSPWSTCAGHLSATRAPCGHPQLPQQKRWGDGSPHRCIRRQERGLPLASAVPVG